MLFSAAYPILTGGPVVVFASLLIAALTRYNYSSIDPKLRVKNTLTDEILSEYDFIIVGAGAAGSVVAARLSEIEGWSVLLLEAGGDETAFTEVPYLTRNLTNTDVDWQFKTEPSNTACLAMPGARCQWPRGKVLGGTSSISGTLYVRGNRRDYDLWESLGNPGWGYSDVLYYFKKSEDNRIPELQNSPYHSTGGPLTISPLLYETPLTPAFLQAAEELGYILRDTNGEFQSGFMQYQYTLRDGHRCSAAIAYLRPARDRQNLDIAMNAYFTRVLIDPTAKEAYGVEFVRDHRYYIAKARKEVIVCAGAIQSPQLLMLSGIGPKYHLQEMSIPVIQDLEVGYNLQDHVGTNGILFLLNDTIITDDPRLVVQNAVDDYAMGTGILTYANFDVIGNVRTKYVDQSDDLPDIQLSLYPCVFSDNLEDTGRSAVDVNRLKAYDAWGVYVCLNRAKSRGRIKLRSNDPFEYPVLIHNYLTEPVDLLTLIEGIKIALKIGNTNAMQKFGSAPHFFNRNCTRFPLYSDAYWGCLIRYETRSAYHMVGTCKMGPCSDPEAVVDFELRVHGIKGLRVIDASIMPTICSGNTNAPAMMIGEKGADLVKKAWLGNCTCSK